MKKARGPKRNGKAGKIGIMGKPGIRNRLRLTFSAETWKRIMQ